MTNKFIYSIEASAILNSSFDLNKGINCKRILLNDSLDLMHLETLISDKEKIENILINISFLSVNKTNLTRKEIRKLFYEEGFKINGKEYVKYKRSSGSSRAGKCLFILKKYFKEMNQWSDCGLKAKDCIKNDLVAYEAYRALSLSNIEFFIELDPKSILVMDDYLINIQEDCIGVDIENGNLTTKEGINQIENNIWDGQGLLDKSIFDKYGKQDKGMMLLRNRFFKCCAFQTDIKRFLNDHKKEVSKLSKLNGYMYNGVNISNIKLIITKSSLKYLKLAKNLDDPIKQWMDNVGELFGVVKTDKPTTLFKGKMVYTSYQLINTLGFNKDEARDLIVPYLEYRNKIRTDFDVYRFYVENSNPIFIPTKNEEKENSIYDGSYSYRSTVCKKLSFYNTDFQKTQEYKIYLGNLMTSFRTDAMMGNVLVNGTNATLFGNGYEMLLNSIFQFDSQKPLLAKGEVCSFLFNNQEEIVGARSPHITMGNLLLAKNKHLDEYKKYFNITNEIIVVDAINNNIQQMLNGCDYDSDFMLLTNNKTIVNSVKRIRSDFKVPVCLAKPQDYIVKDDYEIDDIIAHNKIGEIVNLSQLLNSLYWDTKFENKMEIANDFYKNICKLAVLSGMEIDKAKRVYPVKVDTVLASIREKIKSFKKKQPLFFYEIKMTSSYAYEYIEGKDGIYKKKCSIKKADFEHYNTPMDYVVDVVQENKLTQTRNTALPLSKLINKYSVNRNAYNHVSYLLKDIRNLHEQLQLLKSEIKSGHGDKESIIDACKIEIESWLDINYMKQQLSDPGTLYKLISALENDKESDLKYLTLYLLLEERRQVWKDVIKYNPPINTLVESDVPTDIIIFGKYYKKIKKVA